MFLRKFVLSMLILQMNAEMDSKLTKNVSNENSCDSSEIKMHKLSIGYSLKLKNKTDFGDKNCPILDKQNDNYTSKNVSFTPTKRFGIFNFKWTTLRLLTGLGFLLCLISYLEMKMTRIAKLLNKFPGDRTFPFIGSMHPFIFCSPADAMDLATKKFEFYEGRCMQLWRFMVPTLCIAEAKIAQAVFGSRDDSHKGIFLNDLKIAFGNGLVTSHGETWKNDRKLLNPFFKYQRLDGFLATFNKHSETLIKILQVEFQAQSSFINLYPFLCRLTLDLIGESALGAITSYQYDIDHEFPASVFTMIKSVNIRATQPYLKIPIIWHLFGMGRMEPICMKYLKDNITSIIEKRRHTYNTDVNSMELFIDALLDAGKRDEDIIDHVLTIYGAGFETTSSIINYALFMLALTPQHQAKVHKELDSIFGEDRIGDVTFNDIAKMKYLDMCVKETLRLFPSVGSTLRVPQNDIKLENGRIIPKGCNVLLSIYHLHRDPMYFPNPEKFDPERFLPAENVKRHPSAYAPFGIGARNCIGQKYALIEIKTVLSKILRNFTISTDCVREDLRLVMGVVLEPVGAGIRMKLNKRT